MSPFLVINFQLIAVLCAVLHAVVTHPVNLRQRDRAWQKRLPYGKQAHTKAFQLS